MGRAKLIKQVKNKEYMRNEIPPYIIRCENEIEQNLDRIEGSSSIEINSTPLIKIIDTQNL